LRSARRYSLSTQSSCSDPPAVWVRVDARDDLSPLRHDRDEVSATVVLEDARGDVVRTAPLTEGDDAAAKTATHQSCAKRARSGREVHQPVELGRRDFVVVAKRAVRCA